MLTLRQERFIKSYLTPGTSSGTAAARYAGYKAPKKAAYRLLRNGKVLQGLAYQQRMLQARSGINSQDIVDTLMRAYDKAETSPEMLSACREIAKICGLYKERTR